MTIIGFLEICGALLILSAFAAAQSRRLSVHSIGYLVLNLTGAGLLAVIATMHRSWGFLLLEGTWALVSLIALINLARRRGRPGPVAPEEPAA